MYRKFKAVLLLGLVAGLLLAACGTLEHTGSPPENNSPQVFFANIPVDGTTFSVNPVLYWYGTDNDGTIEQYQYSVKRASEIGSPETYIATATDEDFDWITIWVDSVLTSTRGQIRLFASFDTNFVIVEDESCDPPCVDTLIDCDIDSIGFEIFEDDTVVIYDTLNCISESIQQYMFVRAIDDDDSPSLIKYRQYLRNNHWPQTQLENVTSITGITHISVPRPTATYAGISVSWSGSDSTDYPRNQPDFEFWWRLFGPFDSPEDVDTTNNKLVIDSGDSLSVDGWVRRPEGIWTDSKSTLLNDLWLREGDSDTTRAGYFFFEVRARDDAFAADPTPSTATFLAVDARLERRILVVDDVDYMETHRPLAAMGSGADGPTNMNLLMDRMFAILKDATGGVTDLNYDSEDFYRRGSDDLPIEQLARYALILIIDDDDVTIIPGEVQRSLARFMDIGGNVWIFGRNSFLAGERNPNQIVEPTVYPAGTIAGSYFDVDEIYVPAWFETSIRPITETVFQFIEGNDDFIGALPTTEAVGFPALNVDTSLTEDYFIHPGVRSRANIENFRFKTIPDVNFLVRGTAAVPIYKYISRYAGTAYPHNKVCAVRYIGPSVFNPVFKTAWFSFSPYAIGYDEMVQVIDLMLVWFEEEGST
ncbi:hypothetical protein ACFLQW_03485 [Candidatus Zixiibacteriota bacterium]